MKTWITIFFSNSKTNCKFLRCINDNDIYKREHHRHSHRTFRWLTPWKNDGLKFFLRLRYTSEPNLWMPWALTAVIEELDFKTRDILAREGKKVITFYAFCHKDFISQIIASQYYFNLWHLGLIEKNIWSQLFKLGFISEGQVNNPVLLSYRTLDKDI